MLAHKTCAIVNNDLQAESEGTVAILTGFADDFFNDSVHDFRVHVTI